MASRHANCIYYNKSSVFNYSAKFFESSFSTSQQKLATAALLIATAHSTYTCYMCKSSAEQSYMQLLNAYTVQIYSVLLCYVHRSIRILVLRLCQLFTLQFEAAFTRHYFQHKNEHLVTVLAFCLHANDKKTYSNRRLLNPGT